MRHARLDEAQTEIKIAKRNINNLRYADDITLVAESEDGLKSLWWEWKRRVKKSGLQLSIRKTKIMASSPITSWQTDEEKWKHWQIFFSWAPKHCGLWLHPEN